MKNPFFQLLNLWCGLYIWFATVCTLWQTKMEYFQRADTTFVLSKFKFSFYVLSGFVLLELHDVNVKRNKQDILSSEKLKQRRVFDFETVKEKKPIRCLCVFVLVFSLLHMGQVYIFDLRRKVGYLLCDGATGWRHPGSDMLLFLSRIYQSAALGKYRRCACSMTQHVSDQIKAGMHWSMLQKGKSEHPEKEQPRSSSVTSGLSICRRSPQFT